MHKCPFHIYIFPSINYNLASTRHKEDIILELNLKGDLASIKESLDLVELFEDELREALCHTFCFLGSQISFEENLK